jgi:hypothetical protein
LLPASRRKSALSEGSGEHSVRDSPTLSRVPAVVFEVTFVDANMLIGVPGDVRLSTLIRDFKRITTRIANIAWQRNFFDHRLRHEESTGGRLRSIAPI